MNHETREEWLTDAIKTITEKQFKPAGYTLPAVKVSVGLPYGRGSKKHIGQHWSPESSDDKRGSIFISPILDDGLEVLGVLTHEMVHAAVGNNHHHGPVFRKCATKVGLVGKMTATTSGPELAKCLEKTLGELGPYPHAKLNLAENPVKKQGTRMIKMECGRCGYVARTTMKHLGIYGPLICPCNGDTMEVPENE